MDFWGTLLVDPPSSDDRYKRRRLDDFATILAAADRDLPRRIPADVMALLVDAYARPALLVPPDVDPGARPALEALAASGYALAVVSNTMRTPGAILRKLLDRFGLLEFFKHTTFSDEVGVRKPAAEIFALSLDALGSVASAAVHVGDDVTLDVQGARAAGMRAIHVTSAAGRPPAGLMADAIIPTLRELPAAVALLDAE